MKVLLAVLITGLTLPSSLQSSFPISFPSSHAQRPASFPTQTAQAVDKVALHQALLDLTNPWTVMCVAAHPDDEDGTTLTTLRRKHGIHTVSLFSTYGEGGQNAVGPELYEELGVIRARETREAAEIQGSEPYFLGLRDFGFSKSAEETFRIWGHDEALRRMVLKIRELRPDVIITNHDTTRGHGHHQATGQLVIEAFDAAADPKRFPEQLTQVGTWQPKRLFVRDRSAAGAATAPERETGKSEKKPEKIVSIDPNERDAVRGTTYAEQALAALQRHATQGPWPRTIEERLRTQNNTSGKLPLIRYRLQREAQGIPPLPSEAKNFLEGLSLADTSDAGRALPIINGRPLTEFVDQPGRVLDALIAWRRLYQDSKATPGDDERSRLMDSRVSQALATAAGIALTVNSRDALLVPGVKTTFSINLSNSGDRAVHIQRLSFAAWGDKTTLAAAAQLVSDTETVDRVTPANAKLTVPKVEHLYDSLSQGHSFAAEAELDLEGAKFSLSREISLDVAPAVEISSASPSPYIQTPATLGRPWAFKLRLLNHLGTPFSGLAKLTSVDYRNLKGQQEIVLEPHETHDITVEASAPIPKQGARSRLKPRVVTLSIERQDSNKEIKEGTQRHIQVVYTDAKVTGDLRVGYLPSFDQTLEQSLAALGVKSQKLGIADIQKGGLATLDTIIIDNRGYQAHPELISANANLLKYVAAGGTLIVFYHKDNEWNPNPNRGRPQLAPYPIILSDERVTEETAPIRFLQPRHALLNYPNRITSADFRDWIQERGLYYPKEWDPHYSALFASSDKQESPLRGGLLVARHGRGNYIYTSMVWYRQLAAGVSGAYRMFANLISYGHQQKQKARRTVPQK